MNAHVSGLAVTPVKGTRVRAVARIELGVNGARGDRAFYVIDAGGRMQNGKQLGELQAIVADHDSERGRLRLDFPDGTRAEDTLDYGDPVETRFFSRTMTARPLAGPWSEALSAFVGRPVRIVAPDAPAVDRGSRAGASIISRGSLQRLAEEARIDAVDGRRFRMLVEIDGIGAHEEDGWIGRRVRIGEALVAARGNVGRCLVTSRDPETGEVTLPTLDLLGSYRRAVNSTEPLPFGIYAEVIEPGPVRVGDPVAVED
ncbi:MAG TPA: MOSC N-terminal beta barrel domain-containing protein [Solirubrobacteraceae bacterium]